MSIKITREERVVEVAYKTLARHDHARGCCSDCGGTFRLTSKLDRLVHWFQCNAARGLLKQFKRFSFCQAKKAQ